MTISLLQFIERKQYEFGVHYLAGANHYALSMRVIFQVVILFIIANSVRIGIMAAIKGLLVNPVGHSGLVTVVSFAFAIIICLLPIAKLVRLNIVDILRWRIT